MTTSNAAGLPSTFTSFINGAALAPAGEALDLVDPTTGRVWGNSFIDPAAVDLAVSSSSAAFDAESWQALTPAERGAPLRRLGDLITARAAEIGRLESLANGKSHVTPDMRVCCEEVFGSVVAVQRFENEDEAVRLANGTEFGLAAGFWTSDMARVRRVARRLQAGTVWVNTYRANDVRVPFGRENGVEALLEFSQIKSIVVEYGPATDPFAN